jgi:hypothetical protein
MRPGYSALSADCHHTDLSGLSKVAAQAVLLSIFSMEWAAGKGNTHSPLLLRWTGSNDIRAPGVRSQSPPFPEKRSRQ